MVRVEQSSRYSSLNSHEERRFSKAEVATSEKKPSQHKKTRQKTLNLRIPSEIFKQMFLEASNQFDKYFKEKKLCSIEISEEFVESYNSGIGSEKKHREALIGLEKLKALGGLPNNGSYRFDVDIPKARLGLAILVGINDHAIKTEALKALHQLIKNDDLSKPSALLLVNLAITFAKRMDKELIQKEIVDVQLMMAKIYADLAELIQKHHAKGHINALRSNLKNQLISSSRGLRKLNRLEHTELDFAIVSSLEGNKRIIDDRYEAIELLRRFYNASIAAYMIYCRNMEEFHETMDRAFNGFDPRIQNAWYDASVLLKDYSKAGVENRTDLLVLQSVIGLKGPQLNWRFLYSAIDILAEIVINGKTEEIRKNAFFGSKLFDVAFPGLVTFASYAELPKEPNLRPLLHFEMPTKTDQNLLIRQRGIEKLIAIANNSPDANLRLIAKEAVIKAVQKELAETKGTKFKQKLQFRKFLKAAFAPYKGCEQSWIEETGKFQISTEKEKNEALKIDDTKNGPKDLSQIFHQKKHSKRH